MATPRGSLGQIGVVGGVVQIHPGLVDEHEQAGGGSFGSGDPQDVQAPAGGGDETSEELLVLRRHEPALGPGRAPVQPNELVEGVPVGVMGLVVEFADGLLVATPLPTYLVTLLLADRLEIAVEGIGQRQNGSHRVLLDARR
jgi:hypothetical protein